MPGPYMSLSSGRRSRVSSHDSSTVPAHKNSLRETLLRRLHGSRRGEGANSAASSRRDGDQLLRNTGRSDLSRSRAPSLVRSLRGSIMSDRRSSSLLSPSLGRARSTPGSRTGGSRTVRSRLPKTPSFARSMRGSVLSGRSGSRVSGPQSVRTLDDRSPGHASRTSPSIIRSFRGSALGRRSLSAFSGRGSQVTAPRTVASGRALRGSSATIRPEDSISRLDDRDTARSHTSSRSRRTMVPYYEGTSSHHSGGSGRKDQELERRIDDLARDMESIRLGSSEHRSSRSGALERYQGSSRLHPASTHLPTISEGSSEEGVWPADVRVRHTITQTQTVEMSTGDGGGSRHHHNHHHHCGGHHC